MKNQSCLSNATGSIVLLSNLGYSAFGDVLNCNCFEVAYETAVSLQADKLILMHDNTADSSNFFVDPTTGYKHRWLSIEVAENALEDPYGT